MLIMSLRWQLAKKSSADCLRKEDNEMIQLDPFMQMRTGKFLLFCLTNEISLSMGLNAHWYLLGKCFHCPMNTPTLCARICIF